MERRYPMLLRVADEMDYYIDTASMIDGRVWWWLSLLVVDTLRSERIDGFYDMTWMLHLRRVLR